MNKIAWALLDYFFVLEEENGKQIITKDQKKELAGVLTLLLGSGLVALVLYLMVALS